MVSRRRERGDEKGAQGRSNNRENRLKETSVCVFCMCVSFCVFVCLCVCVCVQILHTCVCEGREKRGCGKEELAEALMSGDISVRSSGN